MAMPQNFALLKTKITSPILFTLFRNKALEVMQDRDFQITVGRVRVCKSSVSVCGQVIKLALKICWSGQGFHIGNNEVFRIQLSDKIIVFSN
jgi:hypothetical protein